MNTKGTCCSNNATTTLIVACSGRSNVGQIANGVMVEMDKSGEAKSFCLAGVGAGLSGFVESAKAAKLILIDGCPTACGKKILENQQIEPARYFVVTEMGIKKEGSVGDIEPGVRLALGQVASNI
jgi:uncharacterized metal-binding protein